MGSLDWVESCARMNLSCCLSIKMLKKTSKIKRKYGQILGVRMTSSDKDKLLEKIEEKLTLEAQAVDDRFYITTPNPEIVLKAQSDPELFKILNKADFSVPDGIGLKIFGDFSLKIVPGRKLMLEICRICERRGLGVFLFGGSLESNEFAVKNLKKMFPALEIKGDSGAKYTNKANPVSEVDLKSHFDTLQKINNFKPSVIFVALGCPKQEYWIFKYLPLLNAKSAMTVGGAADYLSGQASLPPQIFENLGLEWLWRLFSEPERIWRILAAIFVFPAYILFWRIKSKG